MMRRDLHQTWTLKIRAKAKHFHFNLNASKTIRKLFSFSVELKLHPFLFTLKSEPGTSFSRKRKSFKTKCLQIFQNLDFRIAKNKPIAARRSSCVATLTWCANKGTVCVSSVMLGTLAHSFLSFSKNGENPSFILGSFIFRYFAFLLKNYRRRKIIFNLMGVVAFAILGYWAIFHLSNHFTGGCTWRYVWRTWKYAASMCVDNLFPR